MRLKKAFAVILAIAMVFGAVSLASAAPSVGGFADAADNKQANQIAYLKALGVAKGDENGNYNPDAALTRQEFVTFVARLAGQMEAAEFMGGYASRYLDDLDIADWARGPVNLADTNGWVLGYDDGKFHPTDTLTYAQAVTVLIRVLGHESSVTGAWPNAHIVKGINLGLNAGVSLSANTPISRADMGRLLYNALETERLHKVGDKWESLESILEEGKIFGQAFEGKLATVSPFTFDDDPDGWPATDPAAHDDIIIVGADSTNLNSLIGLNVRITVKGGKVTVVEATRTSKAATLVYDTYEKVNDRSTNWETKWYAVFTDGTKVQVNTSTNFVVNGNAASGKLTGATDSAFEADLKDKLKKNDEVIVASSGGVATKLTITRVSASNQVVSADGKEKTKASDPQDHFKIDVSGNDATIQAGSAQITLNGEPASITDLKEDDIVDLTLVDEIGLTPVAGETYNAIKVAATRNVVQGTVTQVRAGSKVVVTLKLADNSSKDYELVRAGDEPTVNTVVKLFLNAAGKAAKVEDVLGAAVDYVLVTGEYTVKTSTGDTHFAIVDQGGEEREIKLKDVGELGNVGSVVNINNLGEVTNAIAPGAVNEYATIRSVDTANKRVTLRAADGTILVTVDGFAAYSRALDGATEVFGDYVPVGDLKKDQKVRVSVNGAGDVEVIMTNVPALAWEVGGAAGANTATLTFNHQVGRGASWADAFAVTVVDKDGGNVAIANVGAAAADAAGRTVITFTFTDAGAAAVNLSQGDKVTIKYTATVADDEYLEDPWGNTLGSMTIPVYTVP